MTSFLEGGRALDLLSGMLEGGKGGNRLIRG